MEGIIDYFAEIPSVYRTIFFIVGITFFWVLEGTIPLFSFEYKKIIHALKNLTLNALQLLIGLGLAGALLLASDFTAQNQFGILYLLGLPRRLFYPLVRAQSKVDVEVPSYPSYGY
jgi:uncharacterized protein YjeT (DUF2065 family)